MQINVKLSFSNEQAGDWIDRGLMLQALKSSAESERILGQHFMHPEHLASDSLHLTLLTLTKLCHQALPWSQHLSLACS